MIYNIACPECERVTAHWVFFRWMRKLFKCQVCGLVHDNAAQLRERLQATS